MCLHIVLASILDMKVSLIWNACALLPVLQDRLRELPAQLLHVIYIVLYYCSDLGQVAAWRSWILPKSLCSYLFVPVSLQYLPAKAQSAHRCSTSLVPCICPKRQSHDRHFGLHLRPDHCSIMVCLTAVEHGLRCWSEIVVQDNILNKCLQFVFQVIAQIAHSCLSCWASASYGPRLPLYPSALLKLVNLTFLARPSATFLCHKCCLPSFCIMTWQEILSILSTTCTIDSLRLCSSWFLSYTEKPLWLRSLSIALITHSRLSLNQLAWAIFAHCDITVYHDMISV